MFKANNWPGRGFQLSFETPKSESLALFHLGERTHDHIIFFPSKSKGMTYSHEKELGLL